MKTKYKVIFIENQDKAEEIFEDDLENLKFLLLLQYHMRNRSGKNEDSIKTNLRKAISIFVGMRYLYIDSRDKESDDQTSVFYRLDSKTLLKREKVFVTKIVPDDTN